MSVLYFTKDVQELLRGRSIAVVGPSIQRSVYKDLVLMLQENRYLTDAEARKKGELTFLGDELLYGGVKAEKTNSLQYRECRSFHDENLGSFVDYFFITRAYSDYVEHILNRLAEKRVDVVVMSSCLWDVHRHYDTCKVYMQNQRSVPR